LATVTCDICQKTHLRQDSEAHITQNVFSHFTTLATELKQAKEKIVTFEREVKEAQSKANSLQQKVTVLENELKLKQVLFHALLVSLFSSHHLVFSCLISLGGHFRF
jgi:peptidoglycan hydrolase CwlO-like protein